MHFMVSNSFTVHHFPVQNCTEGVKKKNNKKNHKKPTKKPTYILQALVLKLMPRGQDAESSLSPVDFTTVLR